MRYITIILAALSLVLCFAAGPTSVSFSYSDNELRESWRTPALPDVQRQNDHWAQRNQEINRERERMAAESDRNMFNPKSYNAPPTWNWYQDGKTQVCKRGYNGSVHCQ